MSIVLLKYAERDLTATTGAISSIQRLLPNVSSEKKDYYIRLAYQLDKQKRTYARLQKVVDNMTTEEIALELENNPQTLQIIEEEIKRLEKFYSDHNQNKRLDK